MAGMSYSIGLSYLDPLYRDNRLTDLQLIEHLDCSLHFEGCPNKNREKRHHFRLFTRHELLTIMNTHYTTIVDPFHKGTITISVKEWIQYTFAMILLISSYLLCTFDTIA